MYNTTSNIRLHMEGAPDMPSSIVDLNAALDLDAPLERVWPLLSDTDRINRLVGLPAFERAEPDQDLTQTVQGHYLGIPVAWRAAPSDYTSSGLRRR